MKAAVIGGAGYIGSNVCKALAQRGVEPVVIDNLSAGYRHNVKWGDSHIFDIRDTAKLIDVFGKIQPDIVLHFASNIEVGAGEIAPEAFYDNNFQGTLSLLNAMRITGANKIIFSSTAATYGDPQSTPIKESDPKTPKNVYGRTKLFCEQLIQDFHMAHGLDYVFLRYFNAAGADLALDHGEEHLPETHLIPLALRAVYSDDFTLKVFGDDYDTADGTCIRDYIHVADLADGHVKAADYLIGGGASDAFNLGGGVGYSVQDIIEAAGRVCEAMPKFERAPRRAGDPPALLADVSRAEQALGFKAQHTDIDFILDSARRFYVKKMERDGKPT